MVKHRIFPADDGDGGAWYAARGDEDDMCVCSCCAEEEGSAVWQPFGPLLMGDAVASSAWRHTCEA